MYKTRHITLIQDIVITAVLVTASSDHLVVTTPHHDRVDPASHPFQDS